MGSLPWTQSKAAALGPPFGIPPTSGLGHCVTSPAAERGDWHPPAAFVAAELVGGSAPCRPQQTLPRIRSGRHTEDGPVHVSHGLHDVAGGAIATTCGVCQVVVVHRELDKAEHDLQPDRDGAELMADHLVDRVHRAEETTRLRGQLAKRITVEVADGAKVLPGELIRREGGGEAS